MNTEQVLDALARHLADAGVAQYNPAGVYTEKPALPAVLFGMLPDKPDTAVAINRYDWSTARDDFNPDVFVQLRFRGAGRDPRTVERLADAVFAVLHWPIYHPTETWNGTHVLMSRRTVAAPIDQDANGRYHRADSYRLTITP